MSRQFTIAPLLDHQTANLRPSFPPVIQPQNAPLPLSPNKWSHSHHKLLSTAGSAEIGAAQAVVDSELARDDTASLSKLQLRLTNSELGNKIQATEELKQRLDDAVSRLSEQSELVSAELVEVDASFSKHEATHEALREVQRLRLTRPKTERVLDAVEHEMKLFTRDLQSTLYPPRLKKLLGVKDAIQKQLHQISEDAARKGIAMKVDATCLDSKAPSKDVRQFLPKQDPQSKPAGRAAAFDAVRVTPSSHRSEASQSTRAWVASAMKMLQKCNKTIEAASQLCQACQEYRSSRQDIAGAGRTRLVEVILSSLQDLQQATDELRAGEAEIEKDLAADQAEIRELQGSIPELQGPLELAEARLMKRARRPVPERVRDSAEKALETEAQGLRLSLAKLRSKQKKLEANCGRLMSLKKEIQVDVENKKETIAIMNQCVKLLETVADNPSERAPSVDQKIAALQKTLRSKMRTCGQVFYAGDQNCDNRLSLDEFGKGLAMMGVREMPSVIRMLFEAYDSDKDGFVYYEDLQSLV